MRAQTAIRRLNAENRRVRAALDAIDPDAIVWGCNGSAPAPVREHPNFGPCRELYERALRRGQLIHDPWAVSFVLFLLGVSEHIGVPLVPGGAIRLRDEGAGVVPENLEWAWLLGTFNAE